jgi:hypothetical protein
MEHAIFKNEDAKTVLVARLFHEASTRGEIKEGVRYVFDEARSRFIESDTRRKAGIASAAKTTPAKPTPKQILREIEAKLSPKDLVTALEARFPPPAPPGSSFWHGVDFDRLDSAIARPDNWRELQRERLEAKHQETKREVAGLRDRWERLHRPRWQA